MNRTILPNGHRSHYYMGSLEIHRIDLPESRKKLEQSTLEKVRQTGPARLYIKYLKKHAVMRWLAQKIWRNGYLLSIRLRSLFSKLHTKNLLPLVPLSRYSHLHMKKYAIARACWINVPMPYVFPAKDHRIFTGHQRYYSPPIQVITVHQAIVYGGTNLTMVDAGVIHHDLYDFKRDYTSEELHSRVVIQSKTRQIQWLTHDPYPEYVDCAATFVDACAENYAHWMSEILPRIALFCTDHRFHNIAIIINNDLHPNIMESLCALLHAKKRKIILLATGRAMVCRTLYVTSATGYIPFEKRNRKLKNHSQGIFHPFPFQVLRRTLQQKEANDADHFYPKKIYLKRNAPYRNISNAVAVEKLLIEHGFTIIEPEKSSFTAQRSIFSHAEIIISTTGSACANAIFSRSGTHIIILMGKHEDMIYRYWLNMLSTLDITVCYVLGRTTHKKISGIHSDFTIRLSDMMDVLTSLESTRP